MRIFWSWQSDTHQATGRHFVREVLAELARDLNDLDGTDDAERPDDEFSDNGAIDDEDEYLFAEDGRIEVDHDTLGVGGSPRIADTILEKIRVAAVFVADVTPVAISPGGKRVPNPNVMIELGYAMRVLEHERITLVMNLAEGAALKYLPFDLRHWRAPAAYKLRKGATDEETKDIAASLKKTLRSRIVPGIRKAIEVKAADHRRTHRAPEFAVTIEGEPWIVTQRASNEDVKSLDDIRAQTPLLPLPAAPDPRFAVAAGPVTRPSSIFSMSGPRSAKDWSVEETKGYNSAVEGYYSAYDQYLQQRIAWVQLKLRSREVQLKISNIGTLPATGLDVEIIFPESIVVHKDWGKFPAEPEPPEPPPFRPMAPGTAFARQATFTESRLDLSDISRISRRTNIDAATGRVSHSLSELKHNFGALFDVFVVSISSDQLIQPFDAQYIITANEPIDPIEGAIHFEVRKLD